MVSSIIILIVFYFLTMQHKAKLCAKMTNYVSKLVILVMVGLPGCCFVKRVVVYSVFCPLMLVRDKAGILSFLPCPNKSLNINNKPCSLSPTHLPVLFSPNKKKPLLNLKYNMV